MAKKPGICKFFQDGGCKYGKKCKFSHATPANASNGDTSGSPQGNEQHSAADNEPHNQADGGLFAWKRLLKRGSSSTQITASMLTQFFQQGLALMEGDLGASQDAIRELAKEEGLAFVKSALDKQLPQADDGVTQANLVTAVLVPLFRWVTHPRVVDSAVLEQEVSVVFNFILGIGGRRMTTLFDFIAGRLESWTALNITVLSRMEMIELSLNVLSKILECNTANVINEAFNQLAHKFSSLLSSSEGTCDESYTALQARKYMKYINLRLDAGKNIPTVQERRAEPVIREQFVLRKDLPGGLSAEGPRHDNDHADITNIKIMPTAQEIASPRAEYLPTTNSKEWHIPGIKGRLDREFRLLREDTIGQLRDTVRDVLEKLRNPRQARFQRSNNSARTYVYESPVLKEVSFNNLCGLEILVEFDQPQALQKLSLKHRQDWWEHCKCLQEGALVCVLDVTGSVLFFEVADSTLRTGNDKPKKRSHGKKKGDEKEENKTKLTLADDPKHGYAALRLVESNRHTVTQTLRWYRNVGSTLSRRLVEFPGVLLASFKHTLDALQEISKQPNIPFTDLISPSESTRQEAHINLPLYARQPGFTYDLKCIATDKKIFAISAQDLRRETALDRLSSRTILDPTQSSAFLDALSRELALVQGPPGTGKSFTGEKIIRTLIANKAKAELGPIVCVCYTNHALDQLLEHLLNAGLTGIIRIGSQSKSERIQCLNLRVVAQSASRTKAEKRSLYDLDSVLRDQVREVGTVLMALEGSASWKSVKSFLQEQPTNHHQQLFGHLGADEEGWQQVVHNPDKIIDNWLHGGSRKDLSVRPMEIIQPAKLSDLTNAERWYLYNSWLREIRDPLIAEIVGIEKEFAKTKIQRDRVRRDVDLRCLQEANIVGLTTTGLARNLDLLRKLRCKVMVCEEAGEVLEAHLLTALLPSVEHAILIGDHLQLRPQIQNYELQSTNPRGEQYSLDLSLFERLVKPPHDDDTRLPLSVLHTQRRMHPSISELIRSTLYPHLNDGNNVTLYPEVVGMKKRLYWLQHENLEAGASNQDPASTSHSNHFEVEMTVALVSHLVRQGEYGPDDIAVLTPYLGQLLKLRRRMQNMFEVSIGDRDMEELEALGMDDSDTEAGLPQHTKGPKPVAKTTLLKSLRVATVDNFQGEEAKVIVISLVRSNPQNKCGFLNTSNRINVLLSRAKHGMYLIGNANTYRPVPMWSSVIDILRANGNFGKSLQLQCPRHPDTSISVTKPDDFLIHSPESGCTEPCDQRLQCGHKCCGRCHSDMLHNAFKCLEKCQRLKRGCTHPCPLPCGERCHDKCPTILTDLNLKLPCGHIATTALCWQSQTPTAIACEEIVARRAPECGHLVEMKCCQNMKVEGFTCEAQCGHERDCGHICKRKCSECMPRFKGYVSSENHGICDHVCGRQYTTCTHSCKDACHGSESCSPCSAPCEVRCSHSRCSKKCHEPCAPCAEAKCASGCLHSQCSMPCAAPCDFLPCSKRCDKVLSCGHQCPSICGESCPDAKFCQACGTELIKATIVDFFEMKEYREIDLNTDPCIFPDCGHFKSASSMDGLMDMASHYQIDCLTGHPSALTASSQPFSMNEVKSCATCRGPLRNVARYGRIVRRAMLDEATKKFINWSVGTHLRLADRLLSEQERLQTTQPDAKTMYGPQQPAGVAIIVPSRSRLKLLQTLSEAAGRTRYKNMIKLWIDIQNFAGEVCREEQPFRRVADLVRYANQVHKTRGDFVFDESVLQVKGTVLANALLLRCELVVLSDFCELRKDGKLANQYGELKLEFTTHVQQCAELVKMASHSKLPRQEVEGNIYIAQFCAISRSMCLVETTTDSDSDSDSGKEDNAKEEWEEIGLAHIKKATDIIAAHPALKDLVAQAEAVENMLDDGEFYQAVTADEMRAVYQAMAANFRGTGHWYTCENGHPFTVGECGMPMEQMHCPECDAPIGGRDHMPAAGVRRAADIENLARDIEGMGV